MPKPRKPPKAVQPDAFIIVHRKLSDLKPAEYNPRRLTEKQFEDLKKSFENLGTLEPAVINTYPGRENIIISGHQRLKVAKRLGMKEYPCLEVSFPPEKEREANIRMNRNSGEWDFDLLANEFDVADLIQWGFEKSEFGLADSPASDPEGETFRSTFKLEIDCAGEEDQRRLFEELTNRGYECRVLAL